MFNLSFTNTQDVVTFTNLCGVDALRNVLRVIDHNSADVVHQAVKLAKQDTLQIDLLVRNTENNNTHQYVIIDLCICANLSDRDLLKYCKALNIFGDHTGSGLKLTSSQLLEILEDVDTAIDLRKALYSF